MAYVQLGNAKAALPYARMAVKKSKKPRESYLQMALALEFENKNFKHVARLLEVLITYFPKKSYYLQLAAVYAELGRDKESMSALELAYLQGMLTSELMMSVFLKSTWVMQTAVVPIEMPAWSPENA